MAYWVTIVLESYADRSIVFKIEADTTLEACYQAAVKLALMMPRDFHPSRLVACRLEGEKTV